MPSGKYQPDRQRQPKRAIAHPPPEANGAMKHKPVEGNPEKQHQVKERDVIDEAQKARSDE